MPHIHTAPGQHDHTVSAYIIRIDGPEPQLLLHRHKKLHIYMQFGGHIELDETPWQAITHELREESGYSLDQLSVLQPVERLSRLTDADSHPQAINHSTHRVGDLDHFHTDIAYAFVTLEEPKDDLGDGESTDIRLFTRHELLNLAPDQILENIRELGIFALDQILPNWQKHAADQI